MTTALILGAYGVVLLGLTAYSLHRGWLLRLYRRHGGPPPIADAWTGPLPTVTVQLPIYNERCVVERLIDAVCALDYPRDRLQIQVLDDSTDVTEALARRRVEGHAARGIEIEHLRRGTRAGYKAGALAHGLARASGELVLILDADFLPPPDLIRRMVPAFVDPRVGMAQARWGYLNEGRNGLTRAQALMLDAHFHFEHGARAAAGLFFNFNGTAGMWRTACVRDAGGWQADTVAEDLDLSYRAQMRGWRFAYLPDVVVPGELPATVRSWKMQQARWARGAAQTARKLLPTLLRGPWSWRIKLDGLAYLTRYAAAPLTLALTVLILPAIVVRVRLGSPWLLLADLFFLATTVGPITLYYARALQAGGRRAWPAILYRMPAILALGIGISVNNTRAALAGLLDRREGEFVRTPKLGIQYSVAGTRSSPNAVPGSAAEASSTGDRAPSTEHRPTVYRARHSRIGTALELVLAAYVAIGLGYVVLHGIYAPIPFLLLFQTGFTSVAAGSLAEPAGAAR